MKLAVIADDDTCPIPTGDSVDALVSCGDVIDDYIFYSARKLNAPPILAVKGNHDSSAEFPEEIVDLHLNVHEFRGIRFGGFNGSWKYKPRGNYIYEQDEVERFLRGFPTVDVFVAHNSPWGVHDRDDDIHYGFKAFNEYIEKQQPSLFLHGHQHVNSETTIGNTRVVGVFGFRTIEL